MAKIKDSIVDLYNPIVNQRNALNRNIIATDIPLNREELYALSDSAIGKRAIEIKKNGIAETPLKFKTIDDEEFFIKKIKPLIPSIVESMLVYGRAVVVLVEPKKGNSAIPLNVPLSQNFNPNGLELRFFSGYDILTSEVDLNFISKRFMKPLFYSFWGERIHHSRVVDFIYIDIPYGKKASYFYGGKSEFQHVYEQLKQAGMLTRSATTISEKVSHTVVKVKNGRSYLNNSDTSKEMGEAFATLANYMNLTTMSIIDSEEDMFLLNSTFPQFSEYWMQLKEVLCAAFGLSESSLFGKNVGGLNSTGLTERTADANTIRALMNNHVEVSLNELMMKCGQSAIEVLPNKATTSIEDAQYDATIVATGQALTALGEDGIAYIKRHGVISEETTLDKIYEELEIDEDNVQTNNEINFTVQNNSQELKSSPDLDKEKGLFGKLKRLLGRG